MKKDFVPSFFSVIAGVAIVLTITLRLWGPEWYKIIVAVFAGVIGGLFFDSPKDFVALLKVAFKKSLEIISVKLPYFSRKLQEFMVKSMPRTKTAIARFLLHLSVYVVMIITYFAIFTIIGYLLYQSGIIDTYQSGAINTLPAEKKTGEILKFLISVLGFVAVLMTLMVSMIFSLQINMWPDLLSDKDVNRLWKGKWDFSFIDGASDEFVKKYFWQTAYIKCSYAEVFFGVIRTASFIFFRAISRFIKAVIGLFFFLPAWIILIAFDIIFIVLLFIKSAAEFYRKATIMVSIALGVVGGTLLASSLIGFTIGAGSLIIGFSVGKYFPKEITESITAFNRIEVITDIRKILFRGMFTA